MGQVYQATDSAHIDAGPEDGQRRRLSMKRNPWLVLVSLALMAVACSAPQEPALVSNAESLDGQLQDRRGEELPVPIVTPGDIQFKTSAFTFVRIEYSGVGSGVWAVDYPAADRNFSALFQDLTGLSTNADGLVLELTDSNLSRYPFIYIVEGGRMSLSEGEVAGLRDYLLGGGFLMVDDFWGPEEWESLRAELRRVFPNREPVELSTDHEIFRSLYEFTEKPQVLSFAAVLERDPSGREAATAEPHYFGLLDDTGRLMAILCHNSDFGDAWEWEQHPRFPREVSWGRGIPMGVNIAVYALSH